MDDHLEQRNIEPQNIEVRVTAGASGEGPSRDPGRREPRATAPGNGDRDGRVGRSVVVATALVVAAGSWVIATSDGADPGAPGTITAPVTVAAPTFPPLTDTTDTTATTAEPAAPTSTTGPSDAEIVAATVDTIVPPDSDGATAGGDEFVGISQTGDGTARRSVTRYVVGANGFEQTVTILDDPVNRRFRLDVDSDGVVRRVVVDVDGDTTYVETGPGTWTTVPNSGVRLGGDDLVTGLAKLQAGPVRSDTGPAWRLVRRHGPVPGTGTGTDGPLVEWVVVMDAVAVPEWARYALGPVAEAAPPAAGSLIGFSVLVGDGRVVQVVGTAEFGSTTQRVEHRIDVLDEAIAIELPAIDPSATSADR